MYRELIPELADRYHVVAPDLPGFGFSEAPNRARFAYRFDHLAQVIDRLTEAPADWTSGTVQADTDGELFWKISTGRGAMPPWKQLSENDRWAVVRSIRTLAGK